MVNEFKVSIYRKLHGTMTRGSEWVIEETQYIVGAIPLARMAYKYISADCKIEVEAYEAE
tara:strand:+ start:942 stop:1121 length:180 start_codon:yes stop_codon:yes gene_type:complete